MAVKVIVPSKTYNDVYMGVKFENGVGIFEDEQLGKDVASVLGYEIEKPEPVKKAPAKKAPAKKKEE